MCDYIINKINKFLIYMIKFILNKICNIVIENTEGLYNIRARRMYFTHAKKHDRFPSDLKYDKEHPINFYIMHNCVNARIFIDKKRVFSIKNINKIYFIFFVVVNYFIFDKFKIYKIYLFRLTDKQKNTLAHKHRKESEYPNNINITSEFEEIEKFWNSDIRYYPEKKYYDNFIRSFIN